MTQYQYKGFDVQKNATATTIRARRHYSAVTHRGYPQEFTTVVENAESAGHANKALEDYVAGR